MIVQSGQTVYLPGRSNTWAFIDIQSFGEQTGITVDGDIYVVMAYPNVLSIDLPFSGVDVAFVNTGGAALSICLLPPNVSPWGKLAR